jgi:hypothetical protein
MAEFFFRTLPDAGAQFLVGVALAAVSGVVLFVFSPRRLWRFPHAGDRGELKLLVSQRSPEATRSYDLPVTGMGQLRAILAIAPSLVQAYGRRWRESLTVEAAEEPINPSHLRGNLISLGGVSRNAVTEELLDEYGEAAGVRQVASESAIRGDLLEVRGKDGEWRVLGGTKAREHGGPGKVDVDYGLILSVPNPWDGEARRCVVFAGVHTYGTEAAAAYFARHSRDPRWLFGYGLVGVVKVKVKNGFIVPGSFEKEHFERICKRRLNAKRGDR